MVDDIEGDLLERFEKRADLKGQQVANRLFIKDVLLLFRPGIIRSFKGYQKLNYYDMFLHNLTITFRSFLKDKSTFIINLIGLSTGIACALFIYLWVHDEISTDKFHEKDKSLYQVMLNHEESGELNTGSETQALLAKALEEEVPEIITAIQSTPSEWFGEMPLSTEEKTIKATGQFSDYRYFELFSYPFLRGNKETALKDKGSIVISKSLADRLFGSPDQAMGQLVKWQVLNYKGEFKVSGVFADVPANSTEQFEFVLPFEEFEALLTPQDIHWGNYNALTYVQVAEGTDIEALNNKIKDFVKEKVDWSNVQLFLRPYSDRYLYSKYENGVQTGGRIEYVRLFTIVSVVILLIACINFVNLSTAKASKRAKEIGVKKALGAQKGVLTLQYLQESLIITFISTTIAVLLAWLFLPQFNYITGKQIELVLNERLIQILVLVTVITGLAAGAYPAIFLSSLKPVAILKGKLNISFGDKWIRQGLVVFQFVLSVILISSILVVGKQIEYIQNKNLGYRKDNLILINAEGKIASDLDAFMDGLRNISGVENSGGTVHTILNGGSYTTGLHWQGENPEIQTRFGNMTVTHNFIETLGVEILEGRSFSKEFPTDRQALVLNEKAIELMKIEDPIGKEVNLWGNDMKIIGVVKDFNFSNLHESISPMFFKLGDDTYSNILIRIKGGSESSTIEQIEKLYSEFNPNYEFNYTFLDQEYSKLYLAEQRVSTLTRYFGTLAILISCLGLFGLTIFTTESRIKEISVRKVLGAGSWRIVSLLTKQFSILVGIAIVIAIPFSYWAASEWLQDYAYKIELRWWFFGLAGILTLVIAWLTVASQTLKTARLNPATNLRNE